MRHSPKILLPLSPFLLSLLWLAPLRPAAAQTYTVTDLGTLPGGTYSTASAINNLGHVTGTADAFINVSPKSTERGDEAFFWHDGKMQDIGNRNALPTSGNDINDKDEIVGSGMDTCGNISAYWKVGVKFADIRGYGCAYGINNKGQIAEDTHAYYDTPPNDQECDINDAGLVVGSADVSAKPGTKPRHAVLWRKGVRQDLGTLGGTESRALAVNGPGQIAGVSSTTQTAADGNPLYHAFFWDRGKMTDLGTLPGDRQSGANALNARGEVVGSSGECACLWRGGKAYDLNALLPVGSGWVLQGAAGINNRGQIVGTGLHGGKKRGYLLTPKL